MYFSGAPPFLCCFESMHLRWFTRHILRADSRASIFLICLPPLAHTPFRDTDFKDYRGNGIFLLSCSYGCACTGRMSTWPHFRDIANAAMKELSMADSQVVPIRVRVYACVCRSSRYEAVWQIAEAALNELTMVSHVRSHVCTISPVNVQIVLPSFFLYIRPYVMSVFACALACAWLSACAQAALLSVSLSVYICRFSVTADISLRCTCGERG